jgi:protein-tyrosine-phosphatase
MMLGSARKDKMPAGTKVDTLVAPGISSRSNDALIEQGKDTSKLHLIVDMHRIGAGLFNVYMEYTYFAPRSGKNHLFELVLMKWPDAKSFMWSICSFPIDYRPQAEAMAKECGLRLADGVPTIFDENGAHQFTLEGPTVFTLENINGHQVYGNNSGAYERLKKEEHQAIDAILTADKVKLHTEMREQGYTDEQIERILAHWDGGNEEYDEPPATAKDGQHRHKSPINDQIDEFCKQLADIAGSQVIDLGGNKK